MACWVVGLPTSFALQNVGVALVAAAGVFFRPPEAPRRFPPWLVPPLLYWAWMIGRGVADPTPFFFQKMQLYLLWGAVPVAVWLNAGRVRRRMPHFLTGFSIWMTAYAVAAAIRYWADPEGVLRQMAESGPFPLPFNTHHIYYGAMMGTAVLIFIDRAMRNRWYGGAALATFALLHITTSRTALASLYAALVGGLGWVAVRRRRWGWLAVVLGGTLAAGVAAYGLFPTFRIKVDTFRHEVRLWREGANPNDRSLLIRWETWKKGLELWQEHPWVGVGIGRFPEAVAEIYRRGTWLVEPYHLPPHMQWLYTAAATGIVGLVLLIWVWGVVPLRALRKGRWLPMAWGLLMAGVFTSEFFLERQTGLAFFLLFWTVWNVELDHA